ncbi:DUF6482 family protein [Legionella sp.]|uniref:DUF6482 family protein n=1 Tax=Legionella sp. TaxID=459 RepID=UPI000CA88BDC|nr:DUF6482 family protein [Legionella sp.]PJE08219.1 MAG: hypothetical protein CK430_12845 [Legionella sp.]
MPNKTHEELVKDAQNKSKVIALIYSPIELHEYIVEIISKDSEKFMQKGNQIIHFNSVDQALYHATNYGAEEFFLCADNTYDECGSIGSAQKFDYIPIHSKYKRSSN